MILRKEKCILLLNIKKISNFCHWKSKKFDFLKKTFSALLSIALTSDNENIKTFEYKTLLKRKIRLSSGCVFQFKLFNT